MSFLCAAPSTRPTSALSLTQLLKDAQRHERQLWAAMPAGGSDQFALAEAADDAWTRLRVAAEALVSQAQRDTTGREMRLAAALLLATLEAVEPQQVGRLQELARQISDVDDRDRASRLDPVAELLRVVASGPFVMSEASHSDVALEDSGADVALTV